MATFVLNLEDILFHIVAPLYMLYCIVLWDKDNFKFGLWKYLDYL